MVRGSRSIWRHPLLIVGILCHLLGSGLSGHLARCVEEHCADFGRIAWHGVATSYCDCRQLKVTAPSVCASCTDDEAPACPRVPVAPEGEDQHDGDGQGCCRNFELTVGHLSMVYVSPVAAVVAPASAGQRPPALRSMPRCTGVSSPEARPPPHLRYWRTIFLRC